ncbi:MAG TPA: hypothetical protein VFC19_20100 [Candidatus Limnocylindrales bacterium]|nr:hypothetical protein [Candidatus Limnocylindrales bacterium]
MSDSSGYAVLAAVEASGVIISHVGPALHPTATYFAVGECVGVGECVALAHRESVALSERVPNVAARHANGPGAVNLSVGAGPDPNPAPVPDADPCSADTAGSLTHGGAVTDYRAVTDG